MLLPKAVFDEMMGERPFRDFVFHLFAERIADLMQLIEEVAFRKLDQRLAALLLGKGRVLHVTHQQLADELGSVREIVSRLLKGFAEQGFVRLAREQVGIVDAAGLRQLAALGSIRSYTSPPRDTRHDAYGNARAPGVAGLMRLPTEPASPRARSCGLPASPHRHRGPPPPGSLRSPARLRGRIERPLG